MGGFVPPIRIQRIWYLFKRQYALEQKECSSTGDLHCQDFSRLSSAVNLRRVSMIRALRGVDDIHRSWMESKIDRMMGATATVPKRMMGV